VFPEDEEIVAEIGDRGLVLANGMELSFRDLARILSELGNTNLLRSIHVLPATTDPEQVALAFVASSFCLTQMQEFGEKKSIF